MTAARATTTAAATTAATTCDMPLIRFLSFTLCRFRCYFWGGGLQRSGGVSWRASSALLQNRAHGTVQDCQKQQKTILLFNGCFVVGLLLFAMLFLFCKKVFWAASATTTTTTERGHKPRCCKVQIVFLHVVVVLLLL